MKLSINIPPPSTPPKPVVKTQLNPNLLARAARLRGDQAVAQFKRERWTTWEQFKRATSYEPPDTYTSQPFSYLLMTNYIDMTVHVASVVKAEPVKINIAKSEKVEVNTGDIVLKPQQQKAVNQAVDVLFKSRQYHAGLIPLGTGKGKTFIAATLIKYLQDNNYLGRETLLLQFSGMRIIYLTPAAVVEKTIRAFKRFDIRGIGHEVLVLSHNALSSKKYSGYYREVEDVIEGNPVKVLKWCHESPDFVIIDECHRFKKEKSKKTKAVLALAKSPDTRWIFMSATPAVVLNDMMLFILAARVKYAGEVVTRHTAAYFLNSFLPANGKRTKPNDAAMKRLYDYLGPAIINPPNDPQKYKAFNQSKLVEFPSERSRERYNEAEQRWLDEMDRLRKGVSDRGRMLAQYQIFTMAEEAEKVPIFADFCTEAKRDGFAPVIGLRFQENLRSLVLELVKRGVFTRDEISIIWGGTKEIKEEDTYQGTEYMQIMNRYYQTDPPGEDLEPAELSKFKKTLKFQVKKIRLDQTQEEYAERNKLLATLNLHNQNRQQRQENIDRFQDGQAKCCIFTLGAGGTGLDLDQQFPHVLPRRVGLTPCYYAEEFKQGLGRCLRIMTLSDVHQYILYFKNTIVTDHMVPLLNAKMRAIASMSGSVDLVQLLEKELGKSRPVDVKPMVFEDESTGADTDDDDDEEDEE